MKTNALQRLHLWATLLLLCGILLLLGMYGRNKQEEIRNLQEEMQLLESHIKQEHKKNLLRLDSLERSVLLQEKINLKLKDSLVLLARKRVLLNTLSHENKVRISRIADPDSLWHEIARQYLH